MASPTNDRESLPRPSRGLLLAAIAGLLGSVPACGGDSGGDDAATDEAPHMTSSELMPGVTLESFTAMCDERGGTVEVIPHCGGVNTCKGFAYDQTTEMLSEHTCKATNTCGGFNCIVPQSA